MIIIDSERIFFFDKEPLDISFNELSSDDLKTARCHVELHRHTEKIHQLFLMFKFNLDCIQNNYTLMNSGEVFQNNNPAKGDEDYIAINAYVNNLISAGRTLIESMECYFNVLHNDDEQKNQYLDYYHNTYDKSFAYRFLIRLRDFSQHGHMPVFKQGHNYYFDLKQILETPHFNHNNALKQQMKRSADEIIEIYRDNPTLSLTKTLAEYVSQLLLIYHKFWLQIEPNIIDASLKFQSIIKSNAQNIIDNGNGFAKFFIYDVVEGNAHATPIDINSQAMLQNFKEEARIISEEYQEALKQLFEATFWIRYTGEGHLEVGTGMLP